MGVTHVDGDLTGVTHCVQCRRPSGLGTRGWELHVEGEEETEAVEVGGPEPCPSPDGSQHPGWVAQGGPALLKDPRGLWRTAAPL